MGFGYGGFSILQILVPAIFVIVIGIMLYASIKGLRQRHYNNQQPELSVEATAVSKRTDETNHQNPVAGDASGAHGFTYSSTTWYYVTFEVESGDRMEFEVSGEEYGMIVEGDHGKLTFQGTRFLSFERYY